MSVIFQFIKNLKRPFIIAEIGVNYYDIATKEKITPLRAADLMIDKAANAGADAVKFQSYKAENLVIKNSPAYWDLKKESCRSQYELFCRYDVFTKKEYEKLAKYCRNKGILFLSTPFDFEAADYLQKLCPIFKISSSDITNWPFLEYIAKKKKPVFLSTGASSIQEIKEAVSVLRKNGCCEICLLHCILCYPTKYKDANLNMIKHLRRSFPRCLIGYSDHTRPDKTMTCLTTAYQMGAKVIEKHFTLDKTLSGNDHYHAMDPDDLLNFRSNIENLKAFKPDQGIIRKIKGSFRKHCVVCEKKSKLYARRSIVVKRDIKKGERLERETVTFKRPGKGISPKDLARIIGKSFRKNIKADSILLPQHIMNFKRKNTQNTQCP